MFKLHPVFAFVLTAALSLLFLPCRVRAADDLAWPAIGREQRPWAYNWWCGSAVDKVNLARELRRYRDGGLGGIHIIPIYGVKGCESRYIDFLSPKWLEMLNFVTEEGRRLDLGVDMTTGTGWCFGGPNVPPEHGGQAIVIKRFPLPLAERLDPLGKTHWQVLVACASDGQRLDVSNKLLPEGRIDWQPNGAGWTLYGLGWRPTNMAVKRAAPGGVGLMINPFHAEAMKHYLERFTEAFAAADVVRPRSMYHDSFEYYGAQWSPDLLDQFAKRRGYRLQDHLDAFAGIAASETVARVKCDYRQTVSDLIVENVFPLWVDWCHQRGMLTRNQAHGSPSNWLDFYALADIPETEMYGHGGANPLVSRFDADIGKSVGTSSRDPLLSKFASSAAHLAGHRLTSAETGSWLAEHFCETLEEMKCLVDRMFVSGVNHVFSVGCAYSPDDAAWPGWLFYAATQMNPRNSIWHDVPTLNAYIARCQSILQSEQADNDVLLYWPIFDYWHESSGILGEMNVHKRDWLLKQPIGATARMLWTHGFGFDYVSDRLLQKVRADRGGIAAEGSRYRVVAVPPTTHMPVDTLRKLLELAHSGATVIFEGHLPQDVPGLGDLPQRRLQWKALLDRLTVAASSDPAVRVARLGQGRLLVGELAAALRLAGVVPESLASADVMFIRRRHEAGRHYFIVNQSQKPLDGWYTLAVAARSIVVMDPLSGRTGLAATRQGKGGTTEVRLRIEPGHSLILRTLDNRQARGPAFHFFVPGEKLLEIAGPWQVEFVAGGPALPKAYETTKLQPWTQSGDPQSERFAGTAIYRTTFDVPVEAQKQKTLCLDFGRVCHSMRVRLNGQNLGTLIMNPYRIQIGDLKPTGNCLELEVTNLSANRIRDLDRRHVPWKVFRDINFISIRSPRFDASCWPLFDSGLFGPVWVCR